MIPQDDPGPLVELLGEVRPRPGDALPPALAAVGEDASEDAFLRRFSAEARAKRANERQAHEAQFDADDPAQEKT